MNIPYSRILEQFPSSLQIQTTSYCNYDCVICPYDQVKSTIKHGVMTDQLFRKIIDECTQHATHVKNIFFTLMNEPLMDKMLTSRIEQTKCDLPKARTIVITNGSLLNDNMAERLIMAGLDLIKISINGYYRKQYIETQDKTDINRVVRNIHRFIELNNGTIRVIISVVKNKLNPPELSDLLKEWETQNITCDYAPFANRGGAVGEFDDMVISKDTTCNYTERCVLPFSILNVLHDGRVILCCNDWHHQGIVGDIQNDTIYSIWNGELINHYRRALIEQKTSNIIPCNRCSMNF
jgi:molybdenum cofactor biosynthesis enzyme MoaA